MKPIPIGSFVEYLSVVENLLSANEFTLYRGQSDNLPLIPSIARKDATIDTTETEIRMLEELIRRSGTFPTQNLADKWDWLVFAQHFGMKTRLLDWTLNPLVALWFACSNPYKMNTDSYVYMMYYMEEDILDKKKDPDPFKLTKTMILRPSQNNQRVIAQTGWFTAHRYSSQNCFVALDKMNQFSGRTFGFQILAATKPDILKKLNSFGTNYQTMYPDFEGICRQLNWERDL